MSLTAPIFERPRFRAKDGSWHAAFMDAVVASGPEVTLDEAAIAAILTLGYPTGDRTVFREVTRQPWLSRQTGDEPPRLGQPPAHGTLWRRPKTVARRLIERLDRELVGATADAREIVLLLTGGLDSRIAALVLCAARDRGDLTAPLRAVTWGTGESRDVAYAGRLARLLRLPWEHIPLGPEHVLENVSAASHMLGVACSPLHLHRMPALAALGPGTVIIAASYGDGIGRAEFSGRHLLELPPLALQDRFNPCSPGAWQAARRGVAADLRTLHLRNPDAPAYALREYEMQGFYMRNMLAHAMCVMEGGGARLVQAFTSPGVYGEMWSLHPAARNDRVYGHALSILSAEAAAMPWARTNRALRGATRGVVPGATRAYHRYADWTMQTHLSALVERWPHAWLRESRIVDAAAVDAWRAPGRAKERPFVQVQNVAWLASLGELLDELRSRGVAVREDLEEPATIGSTASRPTPPRDTGPAAARRLASAARAVANAGGLVPRLRQARRAIALGRGVAAHRPSLPKWAGKRDPTPTRPRSPRC